MGGVEVARKVRAAGKFLPVLMLTARRSEQDTLQGLDVGADDYLAKPFSLEALFARVRAPVSEAVYQY